MNGLEKYHNNEYVTQTVNAMTAGRHVGTALVAKINSRNPHLTVTLFDTTTSDDIDLNAAIKQKIEKELTEPKISPVRIYSSSRLRF